MFCYKYKWFSIKLVLLLLMEHYLILVKCTFKEDLKPSNTLHVWKFEYYIKGCWVLMRKGANTKLINKYLDLNKCGKIDYGHKLRGEQQTRRKRTQKQENNQSNVVGIGGPILGDECK